jgi:hypothetical protein
LRPVPGFEEGGGDTLRGEPQALQDAGAFPCPNYDHATTAEGVIRHWYRHPLGLFQAWGSAAVLHHYLLLIFFSSRVIS